MNGECSRIKVVALGVALGLTWALGMLLVGWTSWLFDWGNSFVSIMGSIYIGFEPTFIGAIIGGIWGFFDALIAGVLIAWFYNMYCSCCKK